MNNLDKFYNGIVTQDNKLRTTTYSQLTDFLQNPSSSVSSENLDKLIDGLANWVNSSNFKVGVEPHIVIFMTSDICACDGFL